MSGWTERKQGAITLTHHSTSSCIELNIDEGDGRPNAIWFDYYQFQDLVDIITQLYPPATQTIPTGSNTVTNSEK